MSTSATLQYMIQINSNFDKANTSFNKFSNNVLTSVEKIQKRLNSVSMNAFIQNVNSAAQGLTTMNEPGMKLSSSLAELKAITGVAGEGLKEIEGYARKNAKTFGGSAADGIESYKLLLSKLSPELAKQPKALQSMGNSVSVLSKQMGGDNAAAADVLTTAMNQYGVSLDDPIRASKDMVSMMNIMSKSAAEGSAELPQIKQALENAGMGAKQANVSFAETNAAIQILDKAGKKGAEGGTALRNVMVKLSQGKYIPPEYQKQLKALGVDVMALADKNKPLADRLKALQPAMKDGALLSAWLGEGADGATKALMEQIPALESLTKSVQGSNDAYRQASDIMESPLEKNKRLQAQIDDFKISLFNGTNGFLGYANVIGQTAQDFSNLMPIISGAGTVFKTLTSATKMQALWTGIMAGATSLWTGVQAAFNAVMAMNPIVLIVMGIVALIGVIAIVVSKTEGWGKAWKHTVSGAKLLWQAFVLGAKAQFSLMTNGFMIGINKIQIAWYKFKNMLGLGDKAANNAEISKLNADVEKRKATIKEGFKKANDVSNQAKEEFKQAFNSVKWKKDDKKTDEAGISSPNIPGTDFGKGGGLGAGANAGSEKMKKSNEAVATGGTKHNYITIKIEELIGLRADSVSGGKETAKQAGEGIADELLRVLALAGSATG